MCNNFLQILKGLLSLARSVEITTDPDQEVVPASDLLRGNARCYVDIVITPPRVLIGLWHCVHIVILPLPLILIYCMNIGNLCSYIYNPQGNANIRCYFAQRSYSIEVFWLTLLISIENAKDTPIQKFSLSTSAPMVTPEDKSCLGECPNRSQDYLP